VTYQQKIRSDFPILSMLTPQGKPFIYLDNAATTQKPAAVLNAIDSFYRGRYSNVHRGAYWPASQTNLLFEKSREKVAGFLNAGNPECIVFTGGTTDSINKVANALAGLLNENDEILISEMEHHSNLVPWQILTKKNKLFLSFIEIDKYGKWKLSEAINKISERTKVIAVSAISNSLGTINDVKSVLKSSHPDYTITLVDAAQSVANYQTDVKALSCGFLTFSAHKMYGPMGVGVLYGKQNLLEKLPPLAYGGGMITEVEMHSALFRNSPHKHEAGTPNVAGVIGLAAAIDYLNEIGWSFIMEHNQELTGYAMKKLSGIQNMILYGLAENHGPIISFNLEGIHPHDVAGYLAEEGIAIRAGHHCTQPLMSALNIQGTCRISFAIYNTKDEVDKLVSVLEKAESFFT
jgi:cysteine desulfurase/selenocysteine lyase